MAATPTASRSAGGSLSAWAVSFYPWQLCRDPSWTNHETPTTVDTGTRSPRLSPSSQTKLWRDWKTHYAESKPFSGMCTCVCKRKERERECVHYCLFLQVKIPSCVLYHYDVAIIPDKCPRRVNREIIEALIGAHADYFGHQKPVFDGRKNLYSRRPLPIGRDRVSWLSLSHSHTHTLSP